MVEEEAAVTGQILCLYKCLTHLFCFGIMQFYHLELAHHMAQCFQPQLMFIDLVCFPDLGNLDLSRSQGQVGTHGRTMSYKTFHQTCEHWNVEIVPGDSSTSWCCSAAILYGAEEVREMIISHIFETVGFPHSESFAT